MVRGLDALICRTGNLKGTVSFFRAVGIPLEERKKPQEPVHYECRVGGIRLAVYEAAEGQAPDPKQAGATLIGFTVDSLDKAFLAAKAAGGRVMMEPEDGPDGRRAVVLDLDGRPVEFRQPAEG